MENIRRVIIDVDVGNDDYVALLLLLNAERLGKIKIEAIVCTSGNTIVDNVKVNVVKILEIARKTDIPVYVGAKKALIPFKDEHKSFHGSNGLGGIKLPDPQPNLNIIKDIPAAVAYGHLIKKYPKEISLICVAPLTNVALAIKLYDKDFTENVKDVWIMGGSFTAVGNITQTAEFNFYADPEAAFIVLENFICPMYLFTLEPCRKHALSLEWRFETFGNTNNDLIVLLNKADRIIFKNSKIWYPYDAFLAAVYINPDLIIKKSEHWATIELHGHLTRGQVVLDHLKQKKPNVFIIENIHLELFKDMLLDTHNIPTYRTL